MNFAENILSRLFAETTPKPSYLSEPITRSSRDRIAFLDWRRAENYRSLSESLYLAYFLKQYAIRPSISLQIFRSSQANALSFAQPQEISHADFHFYFDYLYEQISRLGYLTRSAEREINTYSQGVETVERFTLAAPEGLHISKRQHQLYGNITLEYVRREKQATLIKIAVAYSPDKTFFCDPLSFEDFVDKLFFVN
jgi:hypothetical protein